MCVEVKVLVVLSSYDRNFKICVRLAVLLIFQT